MKMKILFCLLLVHIVSAQSKVKQKSVLTDNISEFKDLKKLLRTKNNVLILFTSSSKEAHNAIKALDDAAQAVKGEATAVLIDCSLSGDTRKLCKKMKVSPDPIALKHFKDGEFHKDYDRQITVSSLINFLRDPTGDLPWEEDESGTDVLHLDSEALSKLLKKEVRPILIMFYAPWCGYCKKLKPDYSAAATELKPDYVLAAIDVNRPENSKARRMYNITGFPTIIYFENGSVKYTYEGENTKDGIVQFMKNPSATPPSKPKEPEWSSDPNSEIVHLMSSNFDNVLMDEKSALVMFYAPWCGHCKRMKPEYEKAAILMKEKKLPGILAAVDATKDDSKDVASKFSVKGYPTVKYFSNGEFKFDLNVRDAEKIIEFMKNPSSPPPPPPPEAQWEDEETNVVHLDENNFKVYLKKKKHVLVMFYAPWCGHCKRAKPEFNRAAESFKDDPRVGLAAVDCTKHQSVCSAYSVKGFPTIKYFSYLKTVREYNGGRTADDFAKFLSNPDAAAEKPKTEDFGKFPGSESLIMLTDDNFKETLKKTNNLLVMFYAPWCGHCTKFKPHFAEASQRILNDKIGALGVVDATVHEKLAHEFDIKGFPTLKLFQKGTFKTDYSGKRTSDDLYNFMKANSLKKKDEL